MASNKLAQTALRKSRAMGPSVRHLINQYNLDPNEIPNSGPHQILLKSDVLSYINKRKVERQYDIRASNTVFGPRPVNQQQQQQQQHPHRQAIKYTADEIAKARYVRRTLDPIEIEVINSGGLMEASGVQDKAAAAKHKSH